MISKLNKFLFFTTFTLNSEMQKQLVQFEFELRTERKITLGLWKSISKITTTKKNKCSLIISLLVYLKSMSLSDSLIDSIQAKDLFFIPYHFSLSHFPLSFSVPLYYLIYFPFPSFPLSLAFPLKANIFQFSNLSFSTL